MPYRLFVDANLLYPPSMRALLLGIAIAGAAEISTSQQVLDEVHRHLAEQIPDAATARVDEIERVLLAAPAGSVVDLGDSAAEPVGLPDPDDEHVVAAAVLAGADGLLTANRKDFPEPLLEQVGLELVDLDTFLYEPLRLRDATWVRAVELALTFPPEEVRTACDLGMRLHNFDCEKTAGVLIAANW